MRRDVVVPIAQYCVWDRVEQRLDGRVRFNGTATLVVLAIARAGEYAKSS